MHCFQHGNIRDVFPVLLSEMLNKWGKRECPFIGTNGDKGHKPELTNCIEEIEVLVLSKRAGEGLVFQTPIWRTTSSL